MGQPDGGWFDETPPHVVRTSPTDQSINVKAKKIVIAFDEGIKLDNASEKVVVSPPQLEVPEIKAQGNRIIVTLLDSLKENTTYTVDFSDAILDNNESNPMGNYTYSFSTGEQIDTMEVSGYVVDASNLEPVKGILVGLYSDIADSAFVSKPLLRVARADSEGHFVIKGVAEGSYRIYALQDMDGDYVFSQKGEMIAFTDEIITPSAYADIRQDTLWSDSLHIKSIDRVGYTHFMPDNIVLKAFNEPLTERYMVKSERNNADRMTFYFSTGDGQLPEIEGLNFDAATALLADATPRADTITYWLRDTTLVNTDTLDLTIRYLATDTLGNLVTQTDTMRMLSRQPYAKRLKEKQKKYDTWRKREERKRKRGEPYDSIMPAQKLEFEIQTRGKLEPDRNIVLHSPTPIAAIDTSKIHLYERVDTLWYKSRFRLKPYERTEHIDTIAITRPSPTTLYLQGEWKPGTEYSLEFDSLAIVDIYGTANGKIKQGIIVGAMEDYSSLFFTVEGFAGKNIVVQLLSDRDALVREVATNNGVAQFFYVEPRTYYLRMYEDINGNGQWDTGNYAEHRQAEPVYYYPTKIECRANWDITESWNPTAVAANMQKPKAIIKQKAERKKTIRNRNAARAREKGIDPPSKNK
ncbi:MAG: Ig-like domain-containing protein [Prevotella sp.]|nr:Ig-like domain-containing protein [Prevotella sp.]